MIDIKQFADRLSVGTGAAFSFGEDPTREEIRTAVRELKGEGLCGRRIAEQRLGPYFLGDPRHGDRELALLEEVVQEEFERSDLCIKSRSEECSRLRGGCNGAE